MSRSASAIRRDAEGRVRTARAVVTALGGRYSSRLGIDVDAGEAEVERWFLAATLFGTRISAAVAERTFGVLDEAGLRRVAQARRIRWDDLVALLDEGGYARYDFRTATRLRELAEVIGERYGGQVSLIGRSFPRYPQLCQALDVLPGWGPVTIQIFLRELRGVWPGAQPSLDRRAAVAARHLGLPAPGTPQFELPELARLASESGLDLRDLEGGLVRLALTHRHRMESCPGGALCDVVQLRVVGTQLLAGGVGDGVEVAGGRVRAANDAHQVDLRVAVWAPPAGLVTSAAHWSASANSTGVNAPCSSS